MIRYVVDGSIFNSDANALVNPVNCKGVMGKGLALEFSKRFPECLPPYKHACDTGKLITGKLMIVQLVIQPNIWESRRPSVVLFPTKIHWQDNSKIEWIEQGLQYLQSHYIEWDLKSIAMPQVGCGLGGLEWEQVKPLIEKYLSDESLEVEVYVRTESKENTEDSTSDAAPNSAMQPTAS
jgi:O-acetyl-ADP-ribose deacetylase (regulator of RNase III)